MHERVEHSNTRGTTPSPGLGGAAGGTPAPSSSAVVAGSTLLVERALSEGRRNFDALGRSWDLLPGVFSPALTSSTGFYTRHLPFPQGGRFLEIGCGAGVTAVQAALSGCAGVTAVDIGPAAAANTARNARRHGVSSRVRVVVGDVFDAVPDTGYDLVFWAIPYVAMPEGYEHPCDLTRAVFDVGHHCCRSYLAGARAVLAPRGRLFLGFGDIGYRDAMEDLAAAHGWRPELLAAERAEPDHHIEHQMFELHDTTRTAGNA
ncbi:SAM-dependent methyltransferase [Nocardiopsis sp. NPDC055824]